MIRVESLAFVCKLKAKTKDGTWMLDIAGILLYLNLFIMYETATVKPGTPRTPGAESDHPDKEGRVLLHSDAISDS